MNLIEQLSSQSGDRTQQANLQVARQCLDDPRLLAVIAVGLGDPDPALAGDCAEVMTQIAMQQPELTAPYIQDLVAVLEHKTTRVRWEAMHTVALTTPYAAPFVGTILSKLENIIHKDKSVIVRDYAADAIGNYAGTGLGAAQEAFPILQKVLTAWDGKHARQALEGLGKAAACAPALREEAQVLVQPYLDHPRGSLRKAAKAAWKAVQEPVGSAGTGGQL